MIVQDTILAQRLSFFVLVNQPNGDLSICLDSQYFNSQSIRAQYAIPTLLEIFSWISGSQVSRVWELGD